MYESTGVPSLNASMATIEFKIGGNVEFACRQTDLRLYWVQQAGETDNDFKARAFLKKLPTPTTINGT